MFHKVSMRCSKDVLALMFITLKVYFTFSIQHIYLYQCNTMTNQRRLDLHVSSYLNYSFKMSLYCLSFFSVTGIWTGIITCSVQFFVEIFFVLKDRSLQRNLQIHLLGICTLSKPYHLVSSFYMFWAGHIKCLLY